MPARQPTGFGQHSVAVVSAAMLGATFVTIIITIWMTIETFQRPMESSLLATLAIAIWFGVFLYALPGAAIIFSLLWPVTRRRTKASNAICLMAGATIGIILAPTASSNMQDASVRQILLFAAIGAVVALIYLLMAAKLAGKLPVAMPTKTLARDDSDQLEMEF